jgi:hypothetical protein
LRVFFDLLKARFTQDCAALSGTTTKFSRKKQRPIRPRIDWPFYIAQKLLRLRLRGRMIVILL